MSKTRFRLQAMREVAVQADNFYDEAKGLGQLAATDFTSRHRRQITDLEQAANTAMKVTDVLNHVKNQTARRDYWREFGPQLLDAIQGDLKKRRDVICKRLGLSGDLEPGPEPLSEEAHEQARQRQQVHLYLIREFVRQLAAHYEYRCMQVDRGIKI